MYPLEVYCFVFSVCVLYKNGITASHFLCFMAYFSDSFSDAKKGGVWPSKVFCAKYSNFNESLWKRNCIAVHVINPIDSFNPAPFYRQISTLKGLSNLVSVDAPENQDVALGLPRVPEAPHCTTPGGIVFGKRCQWCPPSPWLCNGGGDIGGYQSSFHHFTLWPEWGWYSNLCQVCVPAF